jgi:hypothetical protein
MTNLYSNTSAISVITNASLKEANKIIAIISAEYVFGYITKEYMSNIIYEVHGHLDTTKYAYENGDVKLLWKTHALLCDIEKELPH